MRLLSHWIRRRRPRVARLAPAPAVAIHDPLRRCRFELLEERRLLAADIHVGAVYFEATGGVDDVGDTFQITYNGGVPGTQLARIVIDGDKHGNGLTEGDPFFDSELGGLGAFGAVGLSIQSHQGFTITNVQLVDGGTRLVMDFSGFDAGEKLIFSVDVDEQGFLNPSSIAEGREFEGSKFEATLTGPHFTTTARSDIFVDDYNSELSDAGLDLPPDEYDPSSPVPLRDYTAAAIINVPQQTISGKVFEDIDLDCEQDASDRGIAAVELRLFQLVSGQYVQVGAPVLTAADGAYAFDGVLPGTYRVSETQPVGYFSVCAHEGTVGGVPTGVVDSPDVISTIVVPENQNSIQNNFAEARPAELHGHVYHDRDNDGVREASEEGIGGVSVRLDYVPTDDLPPPGVSPIAPVILTTAADGSWDAAGLYPGNWRVTETQPSGWLDGKDTLGTAGGTVAAGPTGDAFVGIFLGSGHVGREYNFGELLPGSIHGRVIAFEGDDCENEALVTPIAGVTIRLLDASGNRIAQTTTDSSGRYSFDDLPLGTYGVEEVQPSGYFQGEEHVGTAGGSVVAPDRIGGIVIGSDEHGFDYDFCEQQPVSISGFVYVDDDNDGVIDLGESFLGGVLVRLLNASKTPTGATATTDASGFYSFTGLAPGTYGVAEVQPAGFHDGKDSPGTHGGTADTSPPGDRITNVVLASGAVAQFYNFGELRPVSLRGSVHSVDADCIVDENALPIRGVTIYLLGASGTRVAQTTTNAAGQYEFVNLVPGTYSVKEVQPAGYYHAGQHVGTHGGGVAADDLITNIVLRSGDSAVEYDFCEHLPATISGYVFRDGAPIVLDSSVDPSTIDVREYRDGALTPDDQRLARVVLELWDAESNPVLDAQGRPLRAVTGSDGYYQFSGLRPRQFYTVRELQPAGYVDSLDAAGTTTGLAANRGEPLAPAVLQLTFEHRYDVIVRINVEVGQHSQLNNFSEVQTVTPPPPEKPFYFVPPGPTPPLEPPSPLPPFLLPVYPPMLIGPPDEPPMMPLGSGGVVRGHTWHLSVIDAGRPRAEPRPVENLVRQTSMRFDEQTWTGDKLNQQRWLFDADQDGQVDEFSFGVKNGIPVTGDFNGDGVTDIGFFIDGEWFLDLNGNGRWDEADLWARLGHYGDLPVTGDWNGDGKTDIGIFGPAWPGDPKAIAVEPGLPDPANDTTGPHKNMPPDVDEATLGERTLKRTAAGAVRADLIDHVFEYGTPGDKPVVGDWNGDGTATIGVYRKGRWTLDINGNGRWDADDIAVQLGGPDDLPVAGDFNGDGIDSIGIYRSGTWYIDTNGDRKLDARDQVFHLGGAGDTPVVGDWNGDGQDEPGIVQGQAANSE